MARKFFYVAAGMLMLALSYHFGAQSATAQGNTISAVGFDPYDRPIIAVGHSIYEMWETNQISTAAIPGTSPIIGISEHNIVLENGDVYGLVPGGEWQFRANFFGSPTPAVRDTWGSVKSRYAPSRGRSRTPTNR